MQTMALLWYIAVFCVLTSLSVRGQENQECLGVFEILNDQGLGSGGSLDGPIRNVSGRAACISACCIEEDCHLAIVMTPQDGPEQCYFVNCMQDGTDMCGMRSLRYSTVYRKKRISSKAEDKTADSTDKCTGPVVVGSCRASFPRFYYNGSSCQEFIYGGCGGNGNNFESLEDCNSACNGTSGAVMSNETPSALVARKRMAPADTNAGALEASVREMTAEDFAELCQAEATTGPCRAAIPRYFFNGTAGACQKFIFGGCKGNKNNYVSMGECQTTCSVTVVPSPRKAPEGSPTDSESVTAPSTDCAAEVESGPCRAAFPRFYYDSSTLSCQPFIYGGCQGNGNRFSSVEECMSQCSGQEGALEKLGHPTRRTPAYVMVGTLAVSSVVALVGLLVVMLRKSKFRRRPRDDKEELLPEDQLTSEQNA